MRILKILYFAFLDTDNLFRSLFGYGIKNNFFKNKNLSLSTNFFDILLYIYNIFFIKFPFYCPSFVPYNLRIIFFGEKSQYLKDKNELDNEGRCFIYINGILGSKNQILKTKLTLQNFFNKPINILFNSSDTIFGDLLESLIGKESNKLTEASTIALLTIISKLLDEKIKKVIVIAYSQGTIIVSNVLNSLKNYGITNESILKKLEIYCFSNCSSNTKYIVNNLPYIENFANQNDFISKLGCNCPKQVKHLVHIDGKIFINKNKYGHLFTLHYLNNFNNEYPSSHLNSYIN